MGEASSNVNGENTSVGVTDGMVAVETLEEQEKEGRFQPTLGLLGPPQAPQVPFTIPPFIQAYLNPTSILPVAAAATERFEQGRSSSSLAPPAAAVPLPAASPLLPTAVGATFSEPLP